MPIIVSQNGKNAIKLDRLSYGLEDQLQQYIYDNPESIPLYDIKSDIQLLILAREFSTSSGPIDALGIDAEGEIYLIETKLYRNPDKRTVLAQVLDYGASLWRSQISFDDLLVQLNGHVQKYFNQSLTVKLQEYYGLDDDQLQQLLEKMSHNLNEGNFKFVILMDSIHDRLKDLIVYMNQNSKFDIYGVELDYYKHETFEIIIPKIFGAEVKKDVESKQAAPTYISADQFMEMASTQGLSDQMNMIHELLNAFQTGVVSITGWVARRTPKNVSFTYTSPQRSGQSLTISVSSSRGLINETMDFWLYDKNIESAVLDAIQQQLQIDANHLLTTAHYGVVAKLPIKDLNHEKFIGFCRQLSAATNK